MTAYVPSLEEKDLKKFRRSIVELASGRSNATGTVTLATSAASTTVNDPNCAAGSVVILMPTTANAATEVGNGTIYVPAATIINGQFVITHANSATTGRTFLYAFCG